MKITSFGALFLLEGEAIGEECSIFTGVICLSSELLLLFKISRMCWTIKSIATKKKHVHDNLHKHYIQGILDDNYKGLHDQSMYNELYN